MRRMVIGLVAAAALSLSTTAGVDAQGDGGYKLVPNWPTLPQGMWFGLREAPPPPAEREAQAAARRARGGAMPGAGGAARPTSPASPGWPSTSTTRSTSSTAAPSR